MSSLFENGLPVGSWMLLLCMCSWLYTPMRPRFLVVLGNWLFVLMALNATCKEFHFLFSRFSCCWYWSTAKEDEGMSDWVHNNGVSTQVAVAWLATDLHFSLETLRRKTRPLSIAVHLAQSVSIKVERRDAILWWVMSLCKLNLFYVGLSHFML